MAIEIARTVSVPRPWGVVGRKFPVTSANDGIAIGEIRYERPLKSIDARQFCLLSFLAL